jgi:shikimate kinase
MIRLLLPIRHAIVATGGGTFMDPDTRQTLNLDGTTVWLDVPFEVVVGRLPADGRRPLAADRQQLERPFALRQTAYAQAHVRVDAGTSRAEDVADRILDRLGLS